MNATNHSKENSEADPHVHGYLVYNKGNTAEQWGEKSLK